MSKLQGKLDKLARECGVNIIPAKAGPPKPKETKARNTLRTILNKHGPGHLRFVLRCIVETKNGKGQLWSETIGAVSDVLAAKPELMEKGSELFEAIDLINFEKLRNLSKEIPIGTRRMRIAVLFFDRLTQNLNLDQEVIA